MTQPRGAAPRSVRIGSRGSPLALWQAGYVAARLRAAAPGLQTEIQVIRTSAEKFPEKPPQAIGVGIFTREIDEELLGGRIDLAVHSLKDLSSEMHPELTIAGIPERESPFDAYVAAGGREAVALWNLPPGAVVGTGSPRRKAQLLHRRPDLRVAPLRGNVETRIRKAREEKMAGTLLAHAGLLRLGRQDLVAHLVPKAWIIPAVGQGALAVTARADREEAVLLARALDHPPTRRRIEAERAFLRALSGGCQVAAGALAELVAEPGQAASLQIEGVLAAPDGATCLRGVLSGPPERAEELGRTLAEDLLSRGGAALIHSARAEGAELGDFQS